MPRRHHRRRQELEHLEAFAIHTKVRARRPQRQYACTDGEPEIELEVRALFGGRCFRRRYRAAQLLQTLDGAGRGAGLLMDHDVPPHRR